MEKNWIKRSENKRIKRQLVLVALIAVFAMITVGAIHFQGIVNHPERYFETVQLVPAAVTPAPTPIIDVEKYLPAEKPGTTPIPTVPPKEEVEADPDPLGEGKPLSGIVNIALFGIDAYENGGTTSGSMPHTDANMIVAINFDTNEVSLISIARDIFTDVPGHDGFYKFNCIFNVGGGLEDPKAGLELTCRAAEEWLGGVSVPYYFGLDYQAAFDVVDAIGGIDYETEIDLFDLDGSRIAAPGLRHLDGRGVLAYLRMRKTAGGLDYMRTARQRKMMVALFQKIKEADQLSQIPGILDALKEDIYTNVTFEQAAALVSYAANIDPANIHCYSIYGDMYEQYDYRYCMVYQDKRQEILKEVYGIDAEPMGVNSVPYEKFLHESGFAALQHLGYAKQLFHWIHSSVDESGMSEAQKKAYAACWKDYTDLQAMFNLTSEWTKMRWDHTVRLSVEDQKQRTSYYQILSKMERKLHTSGDALNKAFGSPVELTWNKGGLWFGKDSVINEVYVDFA